MADYSAEINSAYADISAAGLPITLRTQEVQQDPAAPSQPWMGNTSTTGTAVDRTSVGLFVSLSLREQQDTRIQEGDRALLIPGRDDAGLALSISTNMQLIANGVTYDVVALLKTVAFNEQEILHRVAVRS